MTPNIIKSNYYIFIMINGVPRPTPSLGGGNRASWKILHEDVYFQGVLDQTRPIQEAILGLVRCMEMEECKLLDHPSI